MSSSNQEDNRRRGDDRREKRRKAMEAWDNLSEDQRRKLLDLAEHCAKPGEPAAGVLERVAAGMHSGSIKGLSLILDHERRRVELQWWRVEPRPPDKRSRIDSGDRFVPGDETAGIVLERTSFPLWGVHVATPGDTLSAEDLQRFGRARAQFARDLAEERKSLHALEEEERLALDRDPEFRAAVARAVVESLPDHGRALVEERLHDERATPRELTEEDGLRVLEERLPEPNAVYLDLVRQERLPEGPDEDLRPEVAQFLVDRAAAAAWRFAFLEEIRTAPPGKQSGGIEDIRAMFDRYPRIEPLHQRILMSWLEHAKNCAHCGRPFPMVLEVRPFVEDQDGGWALDARARTYLDRTRRRKYCSASCRTLENK